jgi:hypothetical protein
MAAAVATRTPRVEPLKIEVSKYKAVESDNVLRWFVELDGAIEARRITDEHMGVTFALSNLGGRARLHDPRCFGSLQEFKAKLRRTFEPPRVEFRARAEYLDLKQGKRDIHAYAQHARFLADSIVQDPIDEQTQITAFIKGLNNGPINPFASHRVKFTPSGDIPKQGGFLTPRTCKFYTIWRYPTLYHTLFYNNQSSPNRVRIQRGTNILDG